MSTGLTIVLVLAGLILLYVVVQQLAAYFKFRGVRLVTCPENQQPAGVAVDARHAAATAFRHVLELRLSQCSRWPEKAGCGQECLKQIELAPEDCLVRNILTRWYYGKTCALCSKPLGVINWAEHKPALLGPQRNTLEWNQIRAENLPAVLESHLPVCWNCHMVQTFCTKHPNLVLDRARPWHN